MSTLYSNRLILADLLNWPVKTHFIKKTLESEEEAKIMRLLYPRAHTGTMGQLVPFVMRFDDQEFQLI